MIIKSNRNLEKIKARIVAIYSLINDNLKIDTTESKKDNETLHLELDLLIDMLREVESNDRQNVCENRNFYSLLLSSTHRLLR